MAWRTASGVDIIPPHLVTLHKLVKLEQNCNYKLYFVLYIKRDDWIKKISKEYLSTRQFPALAESLKDIYLSKILIKKKDK